MLFNSPVFLFLFLPLVLGVYFLAPRRLRNLLLFGTSLYFYAWGEHELVALILFSTLVDFVCGRLIERGYRSLGLWTSVVINLLLLGVFKYADFAFTNYNTLLTILGLDNEYGVALLHIGLPIGISFYTFQTMSYTIDVYRGEVPASRNFIDFGAYVALFPQLVAGPIVRYSEVAAQLRERSVTWNKFGRGVERFIIGLAKKVILANSFAEVADYLFGLPPGALTADAAWLGVVAYAFQIYYDFSGYSDMAIGLGLMLGFSFPENFNYPYVARSVRDFWHRWHMTLSRWFRDYLYFSLGGNRRGPARTYLNLLIVFLATGLWHGADWTFVIWGLFHGFFLVLERAGLAPVLERHRVAAHVYTLLVVLVGWVFFRSPGLDFALDYLARMAALPVHDPVLATISARAFLEPYFVTILGLGVLFSGPVYPRLREWARARQPSLRPVYYAGMVALFLVSLAYIAGGSYDPFIYFRF